MSQARTLPTRPALNETCKLLQRRSMSTLAEKYVMALTGLGLAVFVLVHLAGNLFLFVGRDALNSYAVRLEEHFILLWIARIALLLAFAAHVIIGVRLARRSRAARPVRYAVVKPAQSTWAGQNMLLTGLVVLAFVIYHLLHFTFGVTDPANFKSAIPADARGHADVAGMVIAGFARFPVAAAYIVAQLCLGLHLARGTWSAFQSLGTYSENPLYEADDVLKEKRWTHCLGRDRRRYAWLVHAFGTSVAALVVLGNCAIPLAILSGWRPRGFERNPAVEPSIRLMHVDGRAVSALPLDVFDGTLMRLGRSAGGEGTQVAPAARLRIYPARMKPVQSRFQFAEHDSLLSRQALSFVLQLDLFSATWFRCKPRRPIRQIFDEHGTSGQNAQGQFCKIAGLRKIRLDVQRSAAVLPISWPVLTSL